jgi:hypothetical protein
MLCLLEPFLAPTTLQRSPGDRVTFRAFLRSSAVSHSNEFLRSHLICSYSGTGEFGVSQDGGLRQSYRPTS